MQIEAADGVLPTEQRFGVEGVDAGVTNRLGQHRPPVGDLVAGHGDDPVGASPAGTGRRPARTGLVDDHHPPVGAGRGERWPGELGGDAGPVDVVDESDRFPGRPVHQVDASRTMLYTPEVGVTPRRMNLELFLATSRARRGHRPLAGPTCHPTWNQLASVYSTEMVIVDEADWLRTAGLEQLRDFFDRRDLGMTLIGMPGIDKQLPATPSCTAGSASPTNTSRWIRRLADRDGELLARTRAAPRRRATRTTSRPSLRSSGSSAATSASSNDS